MLIGLKILHMLALVFGSVASLGAIYLGLAKGPHDLAAPDYTNTLRKMFRFTSLGAISVLWVTGIMLLFGKYDVWAIGFAFQAKLVFAAILTAIILFVNFMSLSWSRSGGPPSYMGVLSWISLTCLLLIVVFAVVAFG